MLGTGTSTLLEKQIRALAPSRLTLWVRPEMADYARRRIVPRLGIPAAVNEPLDNEVACLMSGRTLHLQEFEHRNDESVVVEEHDVIMEATVRRPGLAPDDILHRTSKWTDLLELPQAPPQSVLVEYLWDLVKYNEESLMADFTALKIKSQPRKAGHYHVVEDENIWLGENVKLAPGVVLDGSKGPVMIDRNASIGANAVISGPCYIGPYASVSPLASIRSGTSIGMMSKVGGEVSNSIMFGYSNKAHDGFLGDSYVGKWVNLGAGTTTSNLKNTYGEITARGGEGEVKTGRRFLGSLIGDHAKTAIGSRLMAGTYLGFSSMLATSGIAPKLVPSFTFLTDKGPDPYRLDKAKEVMQAVFKRRDRVWQEPDDWITDYVARTAPGIERA